MLEIKYFFGRADKKYLRKIKKSIHGSIKVKSRDKGY